MKTMRAKISKDKDFLVLVPGVVLAEHLAVRERKLLEGANFASVTLGSVVENGEELPAIFLRLRPREQRDAIRAVERKEGAA